MYVAASALGLATWLWWSLVGERVQVGRGRAAAVGALIGACAQLLPLVIGLTWYQLLRGLGRVPAPELGAFADFVVILFTLVQAGIGAIVGAILGAVVLAFRKRREAT